MGCYNYSQVNVSCYSRWKDVIPAKGRTYKPSLYIAVGFAVLFFLFVLASVVVAVLQYYLTIQQGTSSSGKSTEEKKRRRRRKCIKRPSHNKNRA